MIKPDSDQIIAIKKLKNEAQNELNALMLEHQRFISRIESAKAKVTAFDDAIDVLLNL